MRLVKSRNYTYEIESEYRLGDTIEFIDESINVAGEEGIVVGFVTLEDKIKYVIEFHLIARGGVGNSIIYRDPESITNVFTSNQIKLKKPSN